MEITRRRSPLRTLSWFCLIVFVLLLPNFVFAGEYYVSINGNDSNTGIVSSPFRSIKKGMSAIKKGDTLYIKEGRYHETIDYNWQTIPSGTSWADAPIISAFPGDKVILMPPGTRSGEVVNLGGSSIHYLIFDGLTIDAINRAYGISTTNGAHHIRFQNIEVKNAKYSGILVGPGSMPSPLDTYQEFINCHVHHNGSSNLDHGFYISTSHNLVKQTRIHDNASFGVIAFQAKLAKRANHNVFVGNEVYRNSTKAATSAGILLSSGDGNMAYNNVVYNSKVGIRVHNNNPNDSKVYNNTIYNTDIGIEVTALSTDAIVKNNIVYQNAINILENGVNTQMASNLLTNPRFRDKANGDFRLQEGSAAIDQGVELVEVTHDFTDATVRPQNQHYDIGAYEFIGSAVDTTAPLSPTQVSVQ